MRGWESGLGALALLVAGWIGAPIEARRRNPQSPAAAGTPSQACPEGPRCPPIAIGGFPFDDTRDTRDFPPSAIDRYACAPEVDEGGPEVLYTFEVRTRALLRVTVTSAPGADVDLHLLRDLDPRTCVARADRRLEHVVDPGHHVLAADTFVDSEQGPLAGLFTLHAELLPLPSGLCALEAVDLATFWPSCAPGIDCYPATDPTDGRVRPFLRTPSIGPVVKEAHLATVAERFEEGGPAGGGDQLRRHYAVSEAETGYAMPRREPWAPPGIGSSGWGRGAVDAPLPVAAEAWYITLYWRTKPPEGTRMIVWNPENGRAVVAAAGYETGPGSNLAIAGVSEEVHDHLGTNHRDRLLIGFAADNRLPYGPIDCPR